VEATELLKKVRRIEIKTRGLSKHIFAGEYHSAFKGRGIAFSEVREYQYGDDIRSIDWNVTARFNHPYVKVYEEERELTVMLLVDVSGSGNFGTSSAFKRDVMTEIAAVLSFSQQFLIMTKLVSSSFQIRWKNLFHPLKDENIFSESSGNYLISSLKAV
jgi:hypothetical protein